MKQIVGSTLRDSKDNDDDDDDDVAQLRTNFESDSPASEFAAKYNKDGLIGGHVIMLDRSEETKLQALSALNAYPGGLQVTLCDVRFCNGSNSRESKAGSSFPSDGDGGCD